MSDEDKLKDAEAKIQTAVYAATAIFEQLEAQGLLVGNGHHMRQQIAKAAADLLRERWCSRDSAPECDCDAPMAGGHWSTCATRKPRDSGKENKGPMTSPDSGERWPGGVKPGFVKPDFGEREETIFLPSVLGHLPNSVLLSLPLAQRILAALESGFDNAVPSLADELRARMPK